MVKVSRVKMKLIRYLIIGLCLMIGGCVTTGNSSYESPTVSRIYDAKGTLVGKIRTNKYNVSRVYDADGKLLYKIK